MHESVKPKFTTAIRKSSLIVLVYFLWKVLRQFIMERTSTIQWITHMIHTKDKGLIGLTILVTVFVSWALSSFLVGSVYFAYQMIRYRRQLKSS